MVESHSAGWYAMKCLSRSWILFVSTLVAAAPLLNSPLHAQPAGNITVYADDIANSCAVSDTSPGSLTLYVIHNNFSGMLSSDFRIVESSQFQASYLGETINTPVHTGTFRAGVFLGYGECREGSLLLGTISYQKHGTSAACSYVTVVAGFIYPWPETQSCFFQELSAPPLGPLYVNVDSACPAWCVVAVEATTWGKVKAMYRD